MILKFHDLLDNEKCYDQLRQLRWPEDVYCPRCGSCHITKRGQNDTHPERQRYGCRGCS
uniref:transposase n=1 Tax=Endozoicomonas sp. Mp262 TaxID=2919499 RepID=UPI00351ACC2B